MDQNVDCHCRQNQEKLVPLEICGENTSICSFCLFVAAWLSLLSESMLYKEIIVIVVVVIIASSSSDFNSDSDNNSNTLIVTVTTMNDLPACAAYDIGCMCFGLLSSLKKIKNKYKTPTKTPTKLTVCLYCCCSGERGWAETIARCEICQRKWSQPRTSP